MYKMQRLEVSGAVRPLQWSLGVKGLTTRSGAGFVVSERGLPRKLEGGLRHSPDGDREKRYRSA